MSTDLETWLYAPVVEFETPLLPYGFDTQGIDKYFIRLKYVDAPWITTLQEARDSDLDQDGVPSWFEVEALFSDPFDGASAGGDSENGGLGDGLADGWEIYYFGDISTADPTVIQSSDGLTNKEKSDLGLSPLINYSDPAATQRASYTYDLVGRLTQVINTDAASTYTLDEEGNILTSN